jgi:hypothetical protein
MNDQETPVKEQAQPPYTWPAYAPGTGQQWRSDGPYASPSYVRRRSHWPWIVLIVVLLFAFVTGGAFFLASQPGIHFREHYHHDAALHRGRQPYDRTE